MPASDVVYVGSGIVGRLVEGLDHRVTVDKTGVSEAVLTYHCVWTDMVRLVRQLQRHPDFTWLLKDTASARRTGGNLAEVEVTFKGVDPEQGGGAEAGENGELTTYELLQSTDTAPIETHPDFETFAGQWDTPASWVNGATFSPKGVFEGFAAGSPKSGVRSFLVPGLIYRRTRTLPKVVTSVVSASTRDLSKIVNRPPEPATGSILPSMPNGYNFLKIACVVETIGEGMRISEDWKSSGPNGWDTDIYENA